MSVKMHFQCFLTIVALKIVLKSQLNVHIVIVLQKAVHVPKLAHNNTGCKTSQVIERPGLQHLVKSKRPGRVIEIC